MQSNTQMITAPILRTKPRMLAWLCTFAVAMLLLLAACGTSAGGGTTSNPTPTTVPTPTATTAPSPTAASGNTMMVSVINGSNGFAFSPASLTVAVGTTVTWQNTTSAPHTVSSDDGKTFDGMLNTGGTFSFTFTKAGTYAYHCNIHPYMKAMIIVH